MKNRFLKQLWFLFIKVLVIAIISVIFFFLSKETINQDKYLEIPSTNKNQIIENVVDENIVDEKIIIPEEKEKEENTITPKVKDTLLPIRIKIPAINVNARLEYVGLTPKGIIWIPKGLSNAAWLNISPLPWDIGTSIIDGHFGYIKNIPGVFNNLYKLQKGDKIYIEYSDKQITFIVRELRTYKKNDNTSDLFWEKDWESHLNIVTCDWIWNNKIKNYSDRLVVFNDKES